MRKLLFIKGPPGSGKSTLARSLGLESYTLNKDTIRLLHRAPELQPTGFIRISQVENEQVEREFKMLMEDRMKRGEFLVLDAIFPSFPKDIIDMAKKYRYDCGVIDLTPQGFEKIQTQNASRPEYKEVPEFVVKRAFDALNGAKPWAYDGVRFTHIPFDTTGNEKHLQAIRSWSSVPLLDLSSYEEVVHIGDLQGCLSVLLDKEGPLEEGQFNPKKFYIFVGDLLDRGIENGKLLKWFAENALQPNVALIWGNHEDHISSFARGQVSLSEEFNTKTLPQILEAGVTPEMAERVCKHAVEALFYEYNGQKVMVTHAGLPTVPAQPELISLRQYSKGTGTWEDPIDGQFERTAPKDWVQVHGHRNHGWQNIQATSRSFNLEDQVEFGGRLRFCRLNKEGFSVGSVRNRVYDIKNSNKLAKKKIKWSNQGTLVSGETLSVLRSHDGVNEKPLQAEESHSHIAAFNFARDVFFKASWDDITVKARGFFVNGETREIVARGYDKFFNIGERPETDIQALMKNMVFPVTCFVKENGYLGNLGYDDKTGGLFVASKSSSSGDFAGWFRNILDDQMTEGQKEGLARFLRDNEASLTFEVIDPENDPHMIAYDKPKLILLDMFHRNETTERLPYEDLKTFAAKFGFDVKSRGMVFQSPEAFMGWYSKAEQDLEYRFKGQDVEGFVFEDQKGFMTKFKAPHYAFWKRMRSQKDRMKKEWGVILEKGERKNAKIDAEPLSRAPRFNAVEAQEKFAVSWENNATHPAQKAFLGWCARQDPSLWDKSIIALREEFLRSKPNPDIWKAPYLPFSSSFEDAKQKQEQSPAPKFLSGKMVQSLQDNVATNTFKP